MPDFYDSDIVKGLLGNVVQTSKVNCSNLKSELLSVEKRTVVFVKRNGVIESKCLAEGRATLRRSLPTALLKRDSKVTVQITHPTHLFRGQTFEVISMFGEKSDTTQVLIALPNGEQQLIPEEWTDRVNHSQYPPGVLFPCERLVVLRQRLDDLLAKDDGQAILKAKKQELDRPGGSYVNERSVNPLESIRGFASWICLSWICL